MRQSRVWEENKGKIHKIEHRKKNCRQEELSYMYDLPQLFSREILNTCEWRNYTDPGKEPMQELEKLIHEAQTRPGRIPVTSGQSKKPYSLQVIR